MLAFGERCTATERSGGRGKLQENPLEAQLAGMLRVFREGRHRVRSTPDGGLLASYVKNWGRGTPIFDVSACRNRNVSEGGPNTSVEVFGGE